MQTAQNQQHAYRKLTLLANQNLRDPHRAQSVNRSILSHSGTARSQHPSTFLPPICALPG